MDVKYFSGICGIKAFVLVIAFVVVVIVVTFIVELVLSTALANQMEAEFESMNKSVAFVCGCHDIHAADRINLLLG